MPNDELQKSKASIDVSLGKEIDSALGDVIRALLKKPMLEAGELIADSIGLLGDRVKRKRLLNAQAGLEDTRKMLEVKNVELKDITPPSEEDLHVLLDGMSVSGDDRIRKLWSGLLASALDPDAVQNIDRPITSAIAALSPDDARIIEYAAFVTKHNRSILYDSMVAAGVEEKRHLTYGDRDRIEQARLTMGERLSDFMGATLQLETEFALQEIVARADWSDNLMRLGLIRPKPEDYRPVTRPPSIRASSLDGRDISEVMEFIEQRISEAEGLALEGLEIGHLFRRDDEKQRVILGVEFTRFGEKLCRACGLL